MAKKKKIKYFFDYSLLFTVMFIAGFGLIVMYSASGYSAQNTMKDAMYFLKRQALFAACGVVAMLVVSRVDYHIYYKLSRPFYVVSLALQIVTAIIGVASHGSARWLKIAGVQFQPAELMKIAVIIQLSTLITINGQKMNDMKKMLLTALWGLGPAVIIAKTNLSTAMIIAGITFFMMWISCKRVAPFAIAGGFAMMVYVFAYPFAKLLQKLSILQEYQLVRIFAWKDPSSYADDTFQTLQGLYAIGSGGIFGKGLGESVQKFLMPEAQNDMIFTIICEELGLFGAVSMILIYAFIIYRMYDDARNAKDLFGSMLVIGIMCHVALQIIFNIAVATNTIPNTGVTLPFVSYGGTSLLILMGEMGIALSVSRQISLET
ncbi:FtsW/RodA/SpoVE family cell cycle protein [Oribacterium sp. WCC10]|uniref:FtsW/RodA/SpoVE family cell cycle protein n=1 Tax=Oribacterium sp. WCC10 TaxID=1855343 RepID=UPI0008EFE202|nr:putative peptidoglycan glycosyltransferase FtsW [Oribacterium sp. WCC10]SFG26427.1 cell division protein FtsW [Oribacterium sp. WCC10]